MLFSRRGGSSKWLLTLAISLFALCFTSESEAYSWMIRHEYSGCNQCHADPSGGGLLTAYGRAQGEVLLRTSYGAPVEEPGRVADFLFGVGGLTLPDSVLAGGDFRYFYFDVVPVGGGPNISDTFLMQSDLEAQVSVGRFRANGSLGYAQKGALPAAITPWPENNVVSRVHWLGVDLGEDRQWTLRAGRMNLPFGIRIVEHTMFVRSQTRTDANESQQEGLSLAYNGDAWRGELMAIAGNYQINPDAFRERGYSGFIEWTPVAKMALGVSSLVTHANIDVQLQTPLWRQAHGLFARWSPSTWVVPRRRATSCSTRNRRILRLDEPFQSTASAR